MAKEKRDFIVKLSAPPETETKEILAESIIRLGESAAKLNRNGLNQKAIIVLLKDATGLSQRDIRTVLNALPELKKMYCR